MDKHCGNMIKTGRDVCRQRELECVFKVGKMEGSELSSGNREGN